MFRKLKLWWYCRMLKSRRIWHMTPFGGVPKMAAQAEWGYPLKDKIRVGPVVSGWYVWGMARKARIQYPGALYHVFNRGLDRRNLFWDDRDREYFLDSMALGVERFHVELHAYWTRC